MTKMLKLTKLDNFGNVLGVLAKNSFDGDPVYVLQTVVEPHSILKITPDIFHEMCGEFDSLKGVEDTQMMDWIESNAKRFKEVSSAE